MNFHVKVGRTKPNCFEHEEFIYFQYFSFVARATSFFTEIKIFVGILKKGYFNWLVGCIEV